jgi:hypothetical protein
MPEVPNNLDTTSGNLGLTDKEENQIVAFLQTLSDGFTRPYPNVDTFTGACSTSDSAATQGNETLIQTPPLPPCASAICGLEPVPGPKPISSLRSGPLTRGNPTHPAGARVRIIEGPEIELATEYLTIVRWKTNNPGGSPVHYGIVHYGTLPNRLSERAESPLRLNPDHSTTLYRVRLNNLKEGMTYYFKVGSMGADGVSD